VGLVIGGWCRVGRYRFGVLDGLTFECFSKRLCGFLVRNDDLKQCGTLLNVVIGSVVVVNSREHDGEVGFDKPFEQS